MNDLFSLEECKCNSEYSIEPHGKGYALYLNRCNHRHGYNLANITEPDMKRLNEMILKLNSFFVKK